MFVSCSEFASEEELVEYLCKTYSDMVASGCENFYLSAQSLVLVPLHYLKDQKVENPQVLESIVIKRFIWWKKEIMLKDWISIAFYG